MSVRHFAFADTFGVQTLAACRSVAVRLFQLASVPFSALARRARINRAIHQLQALDDRTLADIGLHRSGVISAATQVVDGPHADPRRLAR